MHYANGREARNGDKVLVVPSYGNPYIGILYDAQPGNDYCNGRVATIQPSDPTPNLKEVLHIEDCSLNLNSLLDKDKGDDASL